MRSERQGKTYMRSERQGKTYMRSERQGKTYMRSERQGKTYVITWEPVQERLAQEFEKQKTACGGRAPGLPRNLSESYRNLRKNNKRACGGRARHSMRRESETQHAEGERQDCPSI